MPNKASQQLYILTSLDGVHAAQGGYLRVLEFEMRHLSILDHPRFCQMTAVDVSDTDLRFILSTFYRRNVLKPHGIKDEWLNKVRRLNDVSTLYLNPGDHAMVFNDLYDTSKASVQTVFAKAFRKPKALDYAQ